MSEAGVGLNALLRATVDALSLMDATALQELSREAARQSASGSPCGPAEAREALATQGALGELLRSTERSLRMLRGLHNAGLRSVGYEALMEGTLWER